MKTLVPNPTTVVGSAVTNVSAALATTMARGELWRIVTSTGSYLAQGTRKRITCATKANTVDGETLTVTVYTAKTSTEFARERTASTPNAVTFEFDVTGNGGVAGNNVLDISAATTAASVAVILAAALVIAFPECTVVDNLDGTIDILAPNRQMTISDTVAHASFTVALVALVATSSYPILVPNVEQIVDGAFGAQASILRVSADGVASMAKFTTVEV